MRLIDADAFEKTMGLAIAMLKLTAKNFGIEDDAEVQMELKAYQDILNGVKEQTPIDAIPTAWVVKQIQDTSGAESSYYSRLLRKWREENEG